MAETDDKPPGAASLPPLYRNPVPVDSEKHAGLCMNHDYGLGLCAGINMIPVNAVEMPLTAHDYPVVFKKDEKVTPVAVLGLRENENLFVDGNGDWLLDCYIPAYIRRYPFMFFHSPETDQLVLGMDLSDGIIGPTYKYPLFNEDGSPGPLIAESLEFCKSFHAATLQTEEFVAALSESGLLTERQIEVPIGDERQITFSGYYVVDETKLAALDGLLIGEWHAKGWLPFLYAHVFSMQKWGHLVAMLMVRIEQEG